MGNVGGSGRPEPPEDVQRLLQVQGRTPVVPGRPPHVPQVEERIGLAEPVAEVTEDAQRILQVPGRTRIVPVVRRTSPR